MRGQGAHERPAGRAKSWHAGAGRARPGRDRELAYQYGQGVHERAAGRTESWHASADRAKKGARGLAAGRAESWHASAGWAAFAKFCAVKDVAENLSPAIPASVRPGPMYGSGLVG